ncbi:hypothetical protein AVEN_118543-1 [Araneus ventricosus]|uniref:Uncharacterized protein n=1 Tax=Araneus ventricosus TaxID=182803 RepID=A0A4Y2AYF7_ARAVE|nr:hypothetical protein AVEN_118543-1 [Araneus ventricosus]
MWVMYWEVRIIDFEQIAKLISFLTENEKFMKHPPDATSSSDSDPNFSPSPRSQTYGLKPSRGSIPRALISLPTMKSISRNHPGKNRCPESEGSSSQPSTSLHCLGSDFTTVLTSVQEKGEDGCRRISSSSQDYKNVNKPRRGLFLDDNARLHAASDTKEHIRRMGWEILDHSANNQIFAFFLHCVTVDNQA